MHPDITITPADLLLPEHQAAVIHLLNEYALDPMGGCEPLPEFTRTHLVSALSKRPDCLVLLAWAGETAVGLCIAFEGFSTFAARPLINIHDLYVADSHQRLGIATGLLEQMAEVARQKNCCKLTLEVLSGNPAAQSVYRRNGFQPYRLDETHGQAEFWQKPLSC